MSNRLRITELVGYVYCDIHGAIHEDPVDDPFDPYEDEDFCTSYNRRPVFIRAYPSEGF